jgi:6-phosphogluconolactonase (cycloisomerase 2 family)
MKKHCLLLGLLPLLCLCAGLGSILSCGNPAGGNDTPPTTGRILGTVSFTGALDSSGIIVSAEAVVGPVTKTVEQAIANARKPTSRTIAAKATTDTKGSYTLADLPAGAYTVYASSKNALEQAVTTSVTVVAGKDVTAADLDLTPTGSIAGKATLSGASTGNLGTVVFIAGTSYCAITDDNGVYASHDGYTSVAVSGVLVAVGTTTQANTLNLNPGTSSSLTIDCPGGGITTPSGSISVAQGVPVSISALPSKSSFFVNWKIVSGNGVTFGDPSSISTTVTLSGGSATIQASFAREFVYVTLSGGNSMIGYSVDPETGKLSLINGGTISTGAYPLGIASTPDGRFLCQTNVNGNTIYTYNIDNRTGIPTYTLNTASNTAAKPYKIAVDPGSRWLYVISGITSNWITPFAIDAANGYLTPISQCPAQGSSQADGIVEPTGKYLYTADDGTNTISTYLINQTTGVLTAVGGVSVVGSNPYPYDLAAHPSGLYLYSANYGTKTITSYSINPTTGALSPIGSPVSAGSLPQSIDIDPSGRFLYAGDAASGATKISGFGIASDGTLTTLVGSPFTLDSDCQAIAVDPSGKYLYTANYYSQTVGAMSVNPTNGALTKIGNYITAGSTPHPGYIKVVRTYY